MNPHATRKSMARDRSSQRHDPWENYWLHSSGSVQGQLLKILREARSTGMLSLSNLQIGPRLPPEVCHLHDIAIREDGEKFWDNVDLKFLDVSLNNLTELPREIYILDHLERLMARRNQIRSIPVELCRLGETLTLLDIKANRLEFLPEEIGYLQNLVELQLEDNQLYGLPETIGMLRKLAILNVMKNQLVDLPATMGNLSDLEVLDCSRNSIHKLPRSIGGLKSLLLFTAHHNKITELPAEIEGMSRLREFDVSDNQIVQQPETLPASPQLTRCLLGFNRIPDTLVCLQPDSPAFAALCQNMVFLDLSQNKLTSVPPELGALRALENLNLSQNHCDTVPAELGYLPRLRVLGLDGNPIKSIRKAILEGPLVELLAELRRRGPPHWKLGDVVGAEGATDGAPELGERPLCPDEGQMKVAFNIARANGKLHLGDFFLEEVPRETYAPPVAETILKLHLSANRLVELPSELGQCCINLRYLACADNLLNKLPSSILNLPLTILHLSNNKLDDGSMAAIAPSASVPNPTAPLFENLRDLDLARNNLSRVPAFVFNCQALVTIALQRNFVERLDDVASWSRLRNLTNLDLSRNKIMSLGGLVEAAQEFSTRGGGLRVLNLADNDLTEIPLEFARCKTLEGLHLDGNPQTTIRAATLYNGTAATLAFLRAQLLKRERAASTVTSTVRSSGKLATGAASGHGRLCTVSAGDHTGAAGEAGGAGGGTPQGEVEHSALASLTWRSVSASSYQTLPAAAAGTWGRSLEQGEEKEIDRRVEAIERELANISLPEAKRGSLKRELAVAKARR